MTRARRPGRLGQLSAQRLLVGAILGGVLSLLAACGSTASTGLGSHGEQSTVTAATTKTVATPTSTPTLKVPEGVTTCGAVYEGAGDVAPGNALDIESCFYTAFQSCHPAALLYTDMGVDTQENYLFVVQPGANGTCGIARTVKSIGCCGSTSHLVQTSDTCSSVVKRNNTYVVLACGNQGDVTLPS